MKTRRNLFTLILAALLAATLMAPTMVGAAAKVASVKATISNRTPYQYSYVTAKARVLDSKGRPIKGAKVVFSWYYKSTTPKVVKYTDSKGYAYCKRNISRAAVGYKVVVKAKASSGGVSKTASTYFTPRKR